MLGHIAFSPVGISDDTEGWYGLGPAAYCDWLSLKEGLGMAYDHNSWECNGNDRVMRGGGYGSWAKSCRAANRLPIDPNISGVDRGFRVCHSVHGQ